MGMREDVEQALYLGGASAGYRIEENDLGQITVEYPDDNEVAYGSRKPIRYDALSPSPEISRCSEILELDGYDTELVPGDRHHTLVVRGRR